MKPIRINQFFITWWKPLAGIAGFAVMIVYAGGMLHDKVPPDRIAVEPGIPLPADATIIEVASQSYPSRIDIVGSAASERRIQISTRISAVVQDVHVNSGDRVIKGQPLLTLDDREIREQLTAAQAQLHQAQTEFTRVTKLHEREAATQQNLTAAESAYNTARSGVERMQVMLSYAQIVSPIDGVVAERSVEAGDLASPGQPLLSVYDPDHIQLEAPVPVRLINKFAPGRAFEIQLDHPAGLYTGVVKEIVGEIDPASRTRLVKILVDGGSADLIPGTFGRVWVEEEPHSGIYIPASAIIRIGQLEMVQLARDHRMVRRLVKTGSTYRDQVEIIAGLSSGDRIVINAQRED